MKENRVRIVQRTEDNVITFVVQIRRFLLFWIWVDAHDYFWDEDCGTFGPEPFNTIEEARDYKESLINPVNVTDVIVQ